jgi:hypothetical protein
VSRLGPNLLFCRTQQQPSAALITSVIVLGIPNCSKLSAMPEGFQRCSRTKMVLPLRVCLNEAAGETVAALWAHTIDISHIGCRLGGLRTPLSPGQTIALQRGQQKAFFRVIWSNQLDASENQAGIEALDYGRNIWGVELPPSRFAPKASTASATAKTKSVSFPVPAPSAGVSA